MIPLIYILLICVAFKLGLIMCLCGMDVITSIDCSERCKRGRSEDVEAEPQNNERHLDACIIDTSREILSPFIQEIPNDKQLNMCS
jgi:hypothetical protein